MVLSDFDKLKGLKMKTDFKVHKKIDIFVKNTHNGKFAYLCSTNAYKTCKEAVASVMPENPVHEYRAWFAK